MKKVLLTLILLTYQVLVFAQEATQQVAEEAEAYDINAEWSSETKTYLLISFAILSIWLTARTFRDKAEA